MKIARPSVITNHVLRAGLCLALSGVGLSRAHAQSGPDNSASIAAPSEAPPPPPEEIPEPPPELLAEPSNGPEEGPPPSEPTPEVAPPEGQWVFTNQYGWVWMPYDEAYTYVPTNGNPAEFLYGPAIGWRWVIAPWVFGRGPQPRWGARGRAHFAWYARPWFAHREARGLTHWRGAVQARRTGGAGHASGAGHMSGGHRR